jgi:membrane fusion protein, multidrug efflux system
MPNSTFLRSSVAIAPLALMSLIGCQKQGGDAAPPAGGMAIPVTTVSAIAADTPIYLDEIGKTVGTQSVTIVPQVSGPIVARHFVDGQDIKKGDPLFDIDPRPYQAQLDQAKGQLLKDQAQKTTAEWNVAQDTEAMATKAISEQQLHNDTGTRDQAIGSIAVDNAQIETANLNIEYCHIKSPIEGRAGLRLVDVGNVVNAAGPAAGTQLLSIQTLDPIYADFTITEAELLKVQQYMSQGDLKVLVMLPQDVTAMKGPQPAMQPAALAPGEQPTEKKPDMAVIGVPSPAGAAAPATQPAQLPVPRIGSLDFLDNSVQDGSGTVKLRATLPNSDHHFWPGQFVNVRLILMVKKGAVLIPAQATQISQSGPFVYTVAADSSAVFTPIVLGQRQGDLVVIDQGLSAGDQVVLTGQLLVQPHGKLMVTNPPASNSATTKPAGTVASSPASGSEGSHS